jgi:hypothetical protein
MRLLRTMIAGFAALALLAGFVATCPCSMATATAGTHQCCTPSTALRTADDGCCLTTATPARDVASTPEPSLLSAPTVWAVAQPLSAEPLPLAIAVRAALPAPSPPRILRI